jgi:hypothetical protein
LDRSIAPDLFPQGGGPVIRFVVYRLPHYPRQA